MDNNAALIFERYLFEGISSREYMGSMFQTFEVPKLSLRDFWRVARTRSRSVDTIGKAFGMSKVDRMKLQGRVYAGAAKDAFKQHPKKIIGGAIAAAALITMALIYAKKKFSSKNCEKLKGYEREICEQEQAKAKKQTQILALQKSIGECNKSKDPDKCKQKIASRIKALRS